MVENMYKFENSSYFSNYTDLAGYELWKYDTTYDNFYLIDNINKSRYGLSNQPLASLNSNLIFTANDGMTGVEIWKYNEASSLLKDIRKI
jgi:ELWxxDGT repeat protein